jgi:predicted GIY-YIG superfamily endonuclease
MSCVYLLHIDPPLGHARHYTGFTKDDTPDRRLARHRVGHGSKMLAAAVKGGRTLSLVHYWPGGTLKFEAYLKRRGDTKSWCPACAIDRRPLPTLACMTPRFDGRTRWRRNADRAYQKAMSEAT